MALNRLFTNILLFGLCLNIAIYLFGTFGFDPQYSIPFMSLSTWQGWFNITPYSVLFAGAAAVGIGLVSLLLRSGTFAIYAMLIAALGLVITPIQQFVTAIPNAIGAMLPASTNPTPGLTNPIILVIDVIFVFAAFWFIFGLVIQRDIS